MGTRVIVPGCNANEVRAKHACSGCRFRRLIVDKLQATPQLKHITNCQCLEAALVDVPSARLRKRSSTSSNGMRYEMTDAHHASALIPVISHRYQRVQQMDGELRGQA
ncbi:hypothetical protein SCLCIDRAFT_712925 [Scleroderma citrinum Foug A]|uniref:Uncharacterized protein n=1 Tax=Scleroderma citrinum Foug A TaxID=1036808 RepID=A0A0C3EMZ4_9AGAM|nr:hypothetical protein SCLCIDRAFT_712925 [Scleroderma citrinum Foug A]